MNGEEFGVQYSLYQRIDLENVTCLNEEVENSGRNVFKPWEDRKNRDKVSLIIIYRLFDKIWNFQSEDSSKMAFFVDRN